MSTDPRPAMAAVLRRLAAGEGPLWITWGGPRLLLALPSPEVLEHGEGLVLLSTRRGYRVATLTGRTDFGSCWSVTPHSDTSVPQKPPVMRGMRIVPQVEQWRRARGVRI